jgi:hypothetical protein
MNINIAQRIAWILILFSLTAAQEKQVEVVDPYTNVYIAPTPNSKLLGVVNKGEKCTVLSDINDWYRIKVPGITGGWLRKSAVKLLEPSTPPPPLPPPPPPPVEPVSVPTPPVSSDSPVAVVESISVPVVSAEEVSDKPVSAIDTSYYRRSQASTQKTFSSRKEQKRSEQKPEPEKKESALKTGLHSQIFSSLRLSSTSLMMIRVSNTSRLLFPWPKSSFISARMPRFWVWPKKAKIYLL